MKLSPETFEFVPPTARQLDKARRVRSALLVLADVLNDECPEGADKTYAVRQLRTVYHWAYTSIVRDQDGTPRPE